MKKPFFRKQTNCWYVKDNLGKFIRLDPDEEKAYQIWSRLIELSNFRHINATIEALCEGWLTTFTDQLSPERLNKLSGLLGAFVDYIEEQFEEQERKPLAKDITTKDVTGWLRMKRKRHGKKLVWSVARQRDAGQAVQRVYKWACGGAGWLPPNEITQMRFETPEPRDTLVTRAIHETLMKECNNRKDARSFGLVLIALWHSGARPITIRDVTAQHVGPECDWIFKIHKTGKKTKRRLVVRTSPCLATLTKILAHFRPKGPLFLNARGDQWTKDTIARRMARMRKRLKIEEEFTPYSYRHTFATDALLNGVDIATVSTLMGHTSPEMVFKVYGHIGKHNEPMKRAAENLSKMRRE